MALAPPARTDPPMHEPLLDANGQVSIPWSLYFERVSDALALVALFAGLAASPSYADDAAAAAGGVGLGKPYRTGTAVQIRLV